MHERQVLACVLNLWLLFQLRERNKATLRLPWTMSVWWGVNDYRDRAGEYVGEMWEGKPHGEGKWSDDELLTREYVGAWMHGKRHGRGEFTCLGGEKYCGEWKNDKRDGHGVTTHPDGDKYDGDWKDGKQHGHGVYTWANGATETGPYVNNQAHGEHKRVSAAGVKSTLVYGLRRGTRKRTTTPDDVPKK